MTEQELGLAHRDDPEKAKLLAEVENLRRDLSIAHDEVKRLRRANEKILAESPSRAAIPFQIRSGTLHGYPCTVLVYEGEVKLPQGDVIRQERTLSVGDVASDPRTAIGDPLGLAVVKLIRMYRELEDRHAGVLREHERGNGTGRKGGKG